MQGQGFTALRNRFGVRGFFIGSQKGFVWVSQRVFQVLDGWKVVRCIAASGTLNIRQVYPANVGSVSWYRHIPGL